MTKKLILLFCLLFFVENTLSNSQNSYVDVSQDNLYQDLSYLASDELKGRLPGSPEENMVIEYIRNKLTSFGVKAFDSHLNYTQTFQVSDGVEVTGENSLAFSRGNEETPMQFEEHFLPLGFSGNGEFRGDVVFVGYGIEGTDIGFNELEGMDLQGKIALMLRYTPEGEDPNSKFAPYMRVRERIVNLREKGARGVVIYNGTFPYDDDSLSLNQGSSWGDVGIPVIHISRTKLFEFFSSLQIDLDHIQQDINHNLVPKSFEVANLKVLLKVQIEKIMKDTNNILGYIKAGHPDRSEDEWFVIGAHWDHLGMGGSTSLEPGANEIHNGADDNASGVASILELTRTLQLQRNNLKRNIIIVLFGAEEMGTLGSSFFVKNSPVDISKIKFMLNLDMVGRLKENRELTVFGVGTSTFLKETLQKYNRGPFFKLILNEGGVGPSDHNHFYLSKIPVLYFNTGIHSDYHRPSDDIDKINFLGLKEVTDYIGSVLFKLNTLSSSLDYIEVDTPPQSNAGGLNVYMGTIPSFDTTVNGYKISGVSPGSPADVAGLIRDDEIIKINQFHINNIHDFMFTLKKFRPGDIIQVTVKRKDNTLLVNVKLKSR